jgi:predicted enzyme related to lactoylglutathione lyase
MSNLPKFGFILEYVADIDSARHFYEDVLGLKVERVSPAWIQFSDHLAIGSDQSLSGSRDPEVYWIVEDANAYFNEISSKVEVILPLNQKPFGTVFGIKDPAGQPLYLVEFSKDRPSSLV